MNARQLAPGWLVALSCLSAWPAAAQAPAAAPAATAAPAAPAASAATRPASAAAAAPAASAARAGASAPATPAAAAASASASVSTPTPSAAATPAAPAPAEVAKPAPRKPAPKPKARPAAKPASAPAAAAAPAAPPGPSAVELAAHERDLQAIRNALVETAVAAPVRVQSFDWIDSQGRLHEESQFTSDARVRGVRVQAYLDDPNAPPPPAPQVMVDAEALPTGVGRRAASDPAQCLARNGRWRQGLQVDVVAADGPGGQLLPEAARIAQTLVPQLTAAGRESRRWVVTPRPYQPATSYERALLGREADTADWLARIVLLTRGSGQIEAELHLMPQGHAGTARKLVLPLPPLQASSVTWAQRMAEWVGALDQATACDPLWFAVRGDGGQLRLREGGAHGLQVGDRLLLVQRQHLAGRLLEPGAVRSMALLEVESGGGALRWLAGPRPANGANGANGVNALVNNGDWVVLPL